MENSLVLKIDEGYGELIDFDYENFKDSNMESINLLCNDTIIGYAILF